MINVKLEIQLEESEIERLVKKIKKPIKYKLNNLIGNPDVVISELDFNPMTRESNVKLVMVRKPYIK